MTDGQINDVVGRRRRRLPRRTPTSSTSACGESEHPRQHHRTATASTSRPTPARPGRTSASTDTQVIAQHPRRTRPTPTSSTSRRSAITSAPNRERGVFKIDGRRQDVGQDAVPRRQDRRDRPRSSTRTTRESSTPRSWEAYRTPWAMSSGGPGSGLFKSTDGGDTGPRSRATPGLPKATARQDRHRRCRGADPQPRLRASIEADDGGVFRSDDARRDLDAVNERPQPAPARVLLHAHLRRPEGQGHGLGAERQLLQVDRRRQDVHRRSRMPHGDNHDLWIAPNDPKRMIEANDGGANVSINGGADVDGPGLCRPRSSTTSSRRRTCRITSAARSRTTRTACVPSRRPAASDGRRLVRRSAAARAATSRRDPRDPDIVLRRQLRRPAHAARPPHRPGARRSTSGPTTRWATRRQTSRERFQWTFPIVFSPHDPNDALRRLAARLEDDQRGPELDADQPRPDAPRSEDDGRVRRPDHEGQHRRRDLRDDLHDRAVAAATRT